MAHPRIIAQRQAIAVGRLVAAASKLAKLHNLKEQGEALGAITAKDPSMAQMLQAEALADLLEGLEKSSYPQDLGPQTGEQKLSPITALVPDDAIGNITVETVAYGPQANKEEPLVTTETVEIVPAGEANNAGVPRGKSR